MTLKRPKTIKDCLGISISTLERIIEKCKNAAVNINTLLMSEMIVGKTIVGWEKSNGSSKNHVRLTR